jgi:hypothetical protein
VFDLPEYSNVPQPPAEIIRKLLAYVTPEDVVAFKTAVANIPDSISEPVLVWANPDGLSPSVIFNYESSVASWVEQP